jgi:hypothetical protein
MQGISGKREREQSSTSLSCGYLHVCSFMSLAGSVGDIKMQDYSYSLCLKSRRLRYRKVLPQSLVLMG